MIILLITINKKSKQIKTKINGTKREKLQKQRAQGHHAFAFCDEHT